MQNVSKFKSMIEEAKGTESYIIEDAILKVTEEIYRFMKIKKMNKTSLAEKLGKSNAFVTKLLNGTNNFTLSTILKVAYALEIDFDFCFRENTKDEETRPEYNTQTFEYDGYRVTTCKELPDGYWLTTCKELPYISGIGETAFESFNEFMNDLRKKNKLKKETKK